MCFTMSRNQRFISRTSLSLPEPQTIQECPHCKALEINETTLFLGSLTAARRTDDFTPHTSSVLRIYGCAPAKTGSDTLFRVGDTEHPRGTLPSSHGVGWRWISRQFRLRSWSQLYTVACKTTTDVDGGPGRVVVSLCWRSVS